jgi:ABC-2 type transport system permease protein
MNKYLTVFKVSWSNGFVYRLNFLLWRLRSVIVILTVYFFWEATFQGGGVIFGYTKDKILTYVFLTLILRSLILGQRSMDAAGEISDGRLSNYLLKPLNYHFYWFTRDMADKLLNIAFSFLEIIGLYLILRPPIYLQTNPETLIFFGVACLLAMILNFVLGNIASYFSFWTPGNAWGFWFLYLTFQDFLGGVVFPLDIFPKVIYNLIVLLPFPYLLFFPANIYLGKVVGADLIRGLVVAGIWVLLAILLFRRQWHLGLRSYQAEGR